MAREALLVAVDGGGSRTRLWLLDPEGRLLGRGEGGTSNPTAAGVGAAVRAIAEAAQKTGLALEGERLAADGLAGEPSREAGARPVEAAGPSPDGVWPPDRVAVVAIGLAGAAREPEASQMRQALAQLFPRAEIRLVHDGVAALLAGTLGAPGVLLLAGTGSLALAVGPQEEEVRAGGWGYLLGDEGSGYWIGREAIRAALRAQDGRGPVTALTERLCRVAGVARPAELVGPIHRGERDRAWIAGLAQEVVAAAQEGDPVAQGILDGAAGELALLVRAVLARAEFLAGLERVPTVTAGGLFRLGPGWWARVEAALAREAPRARLAGRVEEPVLGAAFLALRAYHGQVPQQALERLRALQKAPGGGDGSPTGGPG